MEITIQDVRKVARLAKLELTAEEAESYTVQLGKIVQFVEQLNSVNTDSVEPIGSVMDLHSVLRDDIVKQGLDRDQALANSPQHDDECFRVPPVI